MALATMRVTVTSEEALAMALLLTADKARVCSGGIVKPVPGRAGSTRFAATGLKCLHPAGSGCTCRQPVAPGRSRPECAGQPGYTGHLREPCLRPSQAPG